MNSVPATVVIVLTLAGVAVGRFPGLRMNRATIVLVGATALILQGAISLGDAYGALDLNTLVLLFGMMVLNVNLSIAGFFRLVAVRVVQRARTPRQLLGLVILSSGVLSAVFLNDTVVLMFTPLVVDVARVVRRSSIPYLVALATAANVGSTATIVGNPQNMVIGVSSGISFVRFTGFLSPVALMGMAIVWCVIVLVYRNQFRSERLPTLASMDVRIYRPLLRKGMIATGILVGGLLAELPLPLASLAAASMLLVTRRLKPERVFREVDWSLLVFFAGLFVVTGALKTTGLTARLFTCIEPLARAGVGGFAVMSAILSNVISNVPAVLMVRSLVPDLPNPEQSWLVLAMATTLAGNLTLLGSVANLIVVESARRRGIRISFMEYLKAGVPITLLTLAWGGFWMSCICGPA